MGIQQQDQEYLPKSNAKAREAKKSGYSASPDQGYKPTKVGANLIYKIDGKV